MPKVEIEKTERPENDFLYIFHVIGVVIMEFLDLDSLGRLFFIF